MHVTDSVFNSLNNSKYYWFGTTSDSNNSFSRLLKGYDFRKFSGLFLKCFFTISNWIFHSLILLLRNFMALYSWLNFLHFQRCNGGKIQTTMERKLISQFQALCLILNNWVFMKSPNFIGLLSEPGQETWVSVHLC